jgi:hypothetical protein
MKILSLPKNKEFLSKNMTSEITIIIYHFSVGSIVWSILTKSFSFIEQAIEIDMIIFTSTNLILIFLSS